MLSPCLICKVVHEGLQADASAAEKFNNWSQHICQYSKEFFDLCIHRDMEESILEIQPCTHGALLEPFPDCFKFFHVEVNMTNVFIKLFQIQDWPPFARTSLRFRYCKV